MANIVLNGEPIDTLEEIASNFCDQDVLKEFRSGTLAYWLDEYGYESECQRIREIDSGLDDDDAIAAIIEALGVDPNAINHIANPEQAEVDEIPDIDDVTDFDSAFKIWQKAAEQGNAVAQLNLGYCYDNGEGVAEDKAQAVKWYRKAAEQEHAAAQFSLGLCYYSGDGVAEDKAEAVKWYRMAAEQGDADAQFCLGDCYADGLGVAEDKVEAVNWYRKAAEQGQADAQYALVTIFERR